MMSNNKNIGEIKGIGPKKQALFNKIGIFTVEDLILNFPNSYKDMRKITPISQLDEGDEDKNYLINGKIISNIGNSGGFNKGRYVKKYSKTLKVYVSDTTGKVQIMFFHSGYLENILYRGREFYFFGKVKKLGNGSVLMVQPEVIEPENLKKEIIPQYKLPKGLSQKEIVKIVKNQLEDGVDEIFPESILEKRNLMPYKESLLNIHFPKSREEYKKAKYRMIYQDLFIMELGIKNMRKKDFKGHRIDSDYKKMAKLFPFALTEAQNKVMKEISDDMKSGKQMNRLLQGDVGSGKTAVAILTLYKAIKEGFQGALMAPTEILAVQHYNTIKPLFDVFGFNTVLLTGNMKKKEREKALEGIKSGENNLIIGTHAIIQDSIEFNNLGIVITDEQHRFGVNQRLKISQKGEMPHIMVMTATPIPRTLAVIVYGDLDISILDSLPKGRMPIKTESVLLKDRNQMYLNILEEIKNSRQVYVVASRIGQDDNDLKSVESLYQELKKLYNSDNNIKIKILHGEMKSSEKDEIMESFHRGEIQVLISTVVIEVGINVPNATVMVIEDANRFGLAQLHQLRGRIGRGSHQSYCYLVSDKKGEIARKRIELMCKSSDGFYIAEKDLELRGPGEIFGLRQHGKLDERFLLAVKHMDILKLVKSDTKKYRSEISEKVYKLVEKTFSLDYGLSL